MYQQERLLAIVQYLKEHKKMSVEQICENFNVSRDTARRDLVKLEEEEMIIRTRGGAMLPTLKKEIKNYQDRLHTVSKEKKAIGKLAASLIKEGESVIMDASTTVQACAEFIETSCTVVTNSINQADILSNKPGVEIHLLGGQLNKEHRFLYGAGALEKLDSYNADKAFIGIAGITEKGLTIAHEEDGFLKRKMIEQAEQVIVLADASKFENSSFFTFALFSQIDVMITDKEPERSFLQVLEENGIEVLLAGN